VIVAGGLVRVAFSAGPATAPSPQDRRIAMTVRSLMADHLSKHPLDDEISQRAIKSLLENYDPRKLYFYQSDIDEFLMKRNLLDDEVSRGNVSFVYTVHQRFLQRLDERVRLVDELAQAPHDYSTDEELVIEPELLRYPQDAGEARERWRKLVKYNLLTLKVDKTPEDEARSKISRRYHSAARRWKQSDNDELLERFLSAITSSFDPHTTYMSPTNLDNFRIQLRLNLEGIGAALQQDLDDGYTVVSSVVPGGAASKDGRLKKDDRIVSVGQGNEGPMVDISEMKLNDVVQLIRGHAGTVVRLGVTPKDENEVKIYSITRAKVELEDSAARGTVFDRGKKADGTPVRVGYIDLPSFYMDMEAARHANGDAQFRSTTRDVRKILQNFNNQGTDVVVLDLRKNGGGSLTEAINLTGLFIDEGPVVQVKDSVAPVQSYDDLDRGMIWSGPLVVLTSKFSASASEILAGAIQDYRRGLIIGDEATHGKGTVQSLIDLGSQVLPVPNPPNYGALKITMQQFYRPNGDSTQKRGVLPDVTLPSLTNALAVGESDLDYAIAFDQVKPAQFQPYDLVAKDMLDQLKTQSEARISQSEEFKKLQRDIERYREIKDAKTIPLNEQKYLARRDSERDAEKEEEKQLQDPATSKPEQIFRDDFYDKEVINIALDYLAELKKSKVAKAN
jgi:carboxyl-terminal processing protease